MQLALPEIEVTPNPIKLATPEEEGVAAPLPEDAVQRRAGMASLTPGWSLDQSWNSIDQEGEEPVRKQVSSETLQLQGQKYQNLIYGIASKGATPEDMQSVTDNMKYEQALAQPRTVFESNTTQAYYNKLFQTSQVTQGSWLNGYSAFNPQEAGEAVAIGKDFTTKLLMMKREQEEARGRAKKEGWADYLGNLEKDFITFGMRTEHSLRSAAPTPYLAGGLIGTHMDEARKAIMRQPSPEFEQTIAQIKENLRNLNDPSMEAYFWDKLLSEQDSMIENAWGAIGLLSLPGIGASAKLARGAFKDTVKNIAKTALSKEDPKIAIPAAIGDIDTAAVEKVASDKTKEVTGKLNPFQDQIDDLMRYLNAQRDKVLENIPDNYRELAVRIKGDYDRLITGIVEQLSTGSKVDRINPDVIKKITEQVHKQIRDTYHGPHNEIMEISDPVMFKEANLWLYEVKIGKDSATYWADREAAVARARDRRWAIRGDEVTAEHEELNKKLADVYQRATELHAFVDPESKEFKGALSKLEAERNSIQKAINSLRASAGVEIKNDGLGWYISKWHPLKETDSIVRENLLDHPDAVIPSSVPKDFLGWLRNPSETLPKDNVTAAKVAAYAPNNFYALFEHEAKEISRLARFSVIPGTTRKNRWDAFESVLDAIAAGATRNPKTGERGYRFENIGELAQFYLTHHERMPSDGEVSAYFTWKRLAETAESMRDLRRYTNDVRQGVKEYRIVVKDKDGKPSYSPWVEGREHPEKPSDLDSILLPGRGENHRVSSRKGPGGDEEDRPKGWGVKEKKHVDDAHKKGEGRYIELIRPGDKPLAGWHNITGDDRPRFIFHDAIEERPLRIRHQAKDNPFEYDTRFSVAQPKIQRDGNTGLFHYDGDVHALKTDSRAEANKWAKAFNEIRVLLSQNKDKEAQALALKLKLPMDWAEHANWYESGRFSTQQEYRVVPHGKNVGMLDNNLRDKYLDRNNNTLFRDGTHKYAGNPDPYEVYTIQNKGGLYNPAYNFVPAKTLSAIPSVNRSLTRVVNTNFLEDYKAKALEHWIQEANPFLKTDSIDEIEHSPYSVFYHTKLKDGIDPQTWSRLEQNRQKIKSILGTPSATDTILHAIADGLSETKGLKILPWWLLPKTLDAGRFLKSAAFHAGIGLFAPAQILVQNANYLTIFGVAGGRYAVPGTAAGLGHQLSRMNENMIPAIDRLMVAATKGGDAAWKPGEFTEARKLLLETGFHKLIAEHVLYDNDYTSRLVKNAGATFLDTATMFFKGSERNQRFAAWYTAYREFRNLNPTGLITNADKNSIFSRAEILSGDMSRVSKSILEKGPWSFATQFLSYNMRMADLMTGSRLTRPEKARLFATYAVMGGFAAGNLFGVPVGDIAKKIMIANNYQPDENNALTYAVEGLPQAVAKMVSGNWYNIPERYFSIGLDPLRDALSGDLQVVKAFTGVVGSQLSTAWDLASPMWGHIKSLFDPNHPYAPVKARDFWEPFQAIKSLSDGARLFFAVNTYNWLSKKGDIMDKDISELNAIFMTFTGLQPYNVAHLHDYRGVVSDRNELWRNMESQFLRYYTHYWEAHNKGEEQNAEDWFSKAKAVLAGADYPVDRTDLLLSRAIKSQYSAVENVMEDLYLKDVPESKRQAKLDLYLKLKDKGFK